MDYAHTRVHTVRATGQPLQHRSRMIDIDGLSERVTIDVDDGVGTDHERCDGITRVADRHRVCFFTREAQRHVTRILAWLFHLIDTWCFTFEVGRRTVCFE